MLKSHWSLLLAKYQGWWRMHRKCLQSTADKHGRWSLCVCVCVRAMNSKDWPMGDGVIPIIPFDLCTLSLRPYFFWYSDVFPGLVCNTPYDLPSCDWCLDAFESCSKWWGAPPPRSRSRCCGEKVMLPYWPSMESMLKGAIFWGHIWCTFWYDVLTSCWTGIATCVFLLFCFHRYESHPPDTKYPPYLHTGHTNPRFLGHLNRKLWVPTGSLR